MATQNLGDLDDADRGGLFLFIYERPLPDWLQKKRPVTRFCTQLASGSDQYWRLGNVNPPSLHGTQSQVQANTKNRNPNRDFAGLSDR